jgi:hypothetical protein
LSSTCAWASDRNLGRDVRPVRPRKQTAAARLDQNAAALAEGGVVGAAIRVPDAIGPLVVQADLRTKKVITSVAAEAPEDGKPVTRVNWLIRQLKEAPDGLLVEVSFANTRATDRQPPECRQDGPEERPATQ